MQVLSTQEVEAASGGGYSGYEGAGAIMAVVSFCSLFTPIGPITAAIALGTTGGLAVAEFMA
jgi:hypothetical protein